MISQVRSVLKVFFQERRLSSSNNVKNCVNDYSKLHRETDAETRVSSYKQLVNAYYDLATVFYEWGWCSSFHFSYKYPFESFMESIRRHEYMLAAQLTNCYGADKKVLDVGCGIAGPARNISKFLQCSVTGISINQYQVDRGNELSAKDKFSNVHSVQGDFMQLPFEPESFDGAYAIEATCHAPDRSKCYHEVFKVLKPGAIFSCYEWCMTDKYDSLNPEHQRFKKDIEEGNGLPDIISASDCLAAMREAGFEIVCQADLALVEDVQPWMTPLMPSWNLFSQRFQFNCVGAVITNVAIYLLELVRIAPVGTGKTQKILQTGGFALRDAGMEGMFTTMYMMVGRKP
jgi:sterol 24-C-methyltransferase